MNAFHEIKVPNNSLSQNSNPETFNSTEESRSEELTLS